MDEVKFLGFLTPEFIVGILAATGVSAWLSSFLSSKSSNTAVQFMLDTLNLIGGNIFKGKNADDDR